MGNKVGRPTKYTEELGEQVIDLMYEGFSIVEVCHELRISKQTFYNWCESHPEFLDSKEKGVDFSEGYWVKLGRTKLSDGTFNYTGWYMNMKNRFNWADKKESTVNHNGALSILNLDPLEGEE
tara:strand:- start:559 stop:927 length:369 start_codon:yes stop_codon:yes gene_type:complete